MFSENHVNKISFIKNINKIPIETREEVKKFLKRTSSKYKDFKYEVYSNGLHVVSDETLIDVVSDIDMLNISDEKETLLEVKNILSKINS